MEGSCECTELEVVDSRQGVAVQLSGWTCANIGEINQTVRNVIRFFFKDKSSRKWTGDLSHGT
jgi:hypothetical protein